MFTIKKPLDSPICLKGSVQFRQISVASVANQGWVSESDQFQRSLARYIENSPPKELPDRQSIVDMIWRLGPNDCLVIKILEFFTALPDGFSTQRDVSIRHCPNFTQVPVSMLSASSQIVIYIENCGVSETTIQNTIQRQNALGYGGPRFTWYAQ